MAPPGTLVAENGDLGQGKRLASKVIEATYRQGYVAHAPIETHAAVANVEGGKVTVWASTQIPFPAQKEVADALGMPLQNVRIILLLLGAHLVERRGTGRPSGRRLAKLTGKPVQVVWRRAEEFFWDSFQPAAVIKIRSGLTDAGRLSFWKYDTYYAGTRGAEQLYAVAHHKETAYGGWMTPNAGGQLFRTRRLARTGEQHEHLCQRIPDRYHGGKIRRGSRSNSA